MIISTKCDGGWGRGLGVHRTKGKLLVQSLELGGGCSEEDRADRLDTLEADLQSQSNVEQYCVSPPGDRQALCYHPGKWNHPF